jgi:hypothetical protein
MSLPSEIGSAVPYVGVGSFLTVGFAALFKSNRDIVKNYKNAQESNEHTIQYQGEQIEQILKDNSEQRHELRTLRMKHEMEMTRNRILMRYVVESGMVIREEDKDTLGIKE